MNSSDATIRFSTNDDNSIDHLGTIDGPVLIAEIDGQPVAAVGIADGRAVADRSRTTSSLMTLLRLRRLEVRAIVAVFGA
jgi:hypothetical protein